jgi:hypothetical protein
MSFIGKTHKLASALSLILNGGMLANVIINRSFGEEGKQFLSDQFYDLNAQLPREIQEVLETVTDNLKWDSLKCDNETKLSSFKGLIESGLGGILELKFSDSIFYQTTHFGLIYPTLSLMYGENWYTDGKALGGVVVVSAFELLYWWDKDDIESHPELN